MQTLEGHTGWVSCIKVLPEERVISGSKDGEIKIWCLKTNGCIQTINAHEDLVREIQVLSDESVVSCGNDKKIKIWDLASASCIKTMKREDEVSSIDAF